MQADQSFGRYVRQRRRELDLTQEELARRVGCAAITIRKIEGDDARPSVQIAERLAMALAIPLDDRAEFVRRGREARPEPLEIITPMPLLEEIGLDDLTGRAIRGYALAEKIGAGGMGAVYRAMQPLVEREVAIKIILPAFANHPDFIRRFEAEAQLVARLEHPHIVPLYDYWREPGIAYLVMRLLRGGSVSTLLKDGALSLEMVNRVLEQVCFALHAAHRIGVIHRDLKPANVLLDEDQNAYLADFGIAKNLGNPNLADQTNADLVIGSPAYLSPEQIQSGSVRPQTDIYCLGVMLYELLTGALPFTGATPVLLIQQHLYAPMPSLAARRAGLPATLDAVIGRATAKDPQDRYADVLGLLDDFRRAAAGLLTRPIPVPIEAEDTTEPINPYKGLRAFGEADAEDYFGREGLIQQLLARLGEGGDLARFLAVVGPSGSGKSSVVKAGLIPALRRGGLVGSENWFVVDFLPGAHPFEELEAALLRIAVNPPASLLEQLKDSERGLVRAARRVLPADEAVQLVLVIDQFEEVFTLLTDEAERALFLSSLVTAVLDERSRVRVVLTLRADFTDRPLRYVDFGELVQRRSELVLPLTPDEVERAILGPARRVGLRLEAGLVAMMIRDVNEQPGALPLLQYALTELFDQREGRTLTKSAYEAIGGVLGALGRRAEEVYRGLSEAEQAAARQIFLRLVTLGEGVEDTRRRVLRSEFESIDDQRSTLNTVLDAFGKHRLLTFDRDPITRGPTVEVAHEALLREWDRLRDWLTEGRTEVRLERLLAAATGEWLAAQRDQGYLLIGARLEQFEGWSQNTTVALTTDERAYLEASIAERDRQQAAEVDRQQRELEAARQLAATERARADEQTQSANRLRTRNRALAVAGALVTIAAIIAVIFGGQATVNATRADQNAQQAQANAATAQASGAMADQQRESAVSAQATAVGESQLRATQKALADDARLQSEEDKRMAVSRELASAALNNLTVDPERSILLALQAISTTDTLEAENALHRAVGTSRVLLTLHDGTETIWSVAYSPDGKRVAMGDIRGKVKIWNATTGQELISFIAHSAPIEAIVFSPDGTRFATASDDKTAKVWDTTTGKELFTLSGHTDVVNGVTFDPTGTKLATASADKTAKIWDATTGKEVLTIVCPDILHGVIFSPDGQHLATTSQDATARVWDAITGKEELILTGTYDSGFSLWGLSYSPDGTKLAVAGDDGTAWVWDVSSATIASDAARVLFTKQYPAGGGSADIAFSPDGTRLAIGGGVPAVWDATSGEELFSLPGGQGQVNSVDFSPDGTRLVTSSANGTVKIWDVGLHGEWLTLAAHTGRARTVVFSPDGTRLATGGDDHMARIYDVTSGKELFAFDHQTTRVSSLDFGPDGSRLATTAVLDKVAKIWDLAASRDPLTLSGHTDLVVGVDFSPDGRRLATASYDGSAKVWDLSTGTELITIPARSGGGVWSVAFSPDGKHLATGSMNAERTNGEVKIWDAVTEQELLNLGDTAGDSSLAWSVAFSPDGTHLAASYNDKTVRIWDVSPGADDKQPVLVLPAHEDSVWRVAFSIDGTRLATASFDRTAKLWALSDNAAKAQELATFTGSTAEVSGVAISPDGKYVATTSWDGSLRVYLTRTEDLVALARTRVTRSLTTDECQKYLHMEQCPAQ